MLKTQITQKKKKNKNHCITSSTTLTKSEAFPGFSFTNNKVEVLSPSDLQLTFPALSPTPSLLYLSARLILLPGNKHTLWGFPPPIVPFFPRSNLPSPLDPPVISLFLILQIRILSRVCIPTIFCLCLFSWHLTCLNFGM